MNLPSFLCPAFEIYKPEVGTEVKMFSNSTRALLRLKPIAGKVAAAITVLQRNGSQEQDHKYYSQGQKDDGTNVTEVLGLDGKRAREMQVDLTNAVKDLIETLLSEDNAAVLGYLLLDSMREVAPRGKAFPDDGTCAEFAQDIDIATLGEILITWGKVNRRAFDPLVEMLPQALQDKVESAVQAATGSSKTETGATSETPSSAPAPTLVEAGAPSTS